MKLPKWNYPAIIGILIGIAFWVGVIYSLSTDKKNSSVKTQNLISALTDSIQKFKDKDSIQTARIITFESEKTEAFLKLKIQDSTVVALQKEVKRLDTKLKKGGSVTVIGSTTNLDTTAKTVVRYDTIHDSIFPVYTASFKDEWIQLSTEAHHASTDFKLRVVNKYIVAIGYEGKTPFCEVKNLNPYSDVEIMKSYQVYVPKIKPKRIGIGGQAGYGITPHGFGPYLGVGVSYNFIRF